jgi:serine/threonine protein kinase
MSCKTRTHLVSALSSVCYTPGPQVTQSAVHGLDPVGRIGRYDILGRLAMGGMAEIFLARERGPRSASRELVVKRVLPHVASDPKLIDMFVQEARLCMRLRHPNICPIYEFGEEDGVFYLAMEWVDGIPLSQFSGEARKVNGLPIAMAAKIIADVAAALHHAHTATGADGKALGIVHRDVTPENIMIGFDGVTRLLDFGIAKAATQPDKTQAGVLKGKFAYMSPEQYQGDVLDGRSDVFSLGVCLYEALTGQSLYTRANEYETVAAIILETEVPSIRDVRPELPALLDSVCKTALTKDRLHRFPNADAMEAALSRWLNESQNNVRKADIARYVTQMFPTAAAGPQLDRTPLAVPRGDATGSQVTGTELYALNADLDDVEEEMAKQGRRKSRALVFVAAVLVLGVLAVAGLALNDGPPADDAPRDAGAEIHQ